MEEYSCYTPKQIHERMTETSKTKSDYRFSQLVILGFMAGLCLALGASASNVAMHNIANVGVARLVAGCVFPVGLISLVLAGGELFTGNALMLTGLANGNIKLAGLLRNWIIVFFTNMLGAVFIALLISQTGQWDFTDGMLGAMTIKIAVGKVSLTPWKAFCSGIMCNIFVCLAVLMASAAKAIIGKIVSIFLPICAFVISGYEHCVANMYYIPAGLIAKGNAAYVDKAQELYGITADQLTQLTVGHFLYDNMLFVTLGNIVGGGVVVGLMYYYGYVHQPKAKAEEETVEKQETNVEKKTADKTEKKTAEKQETNVEKKTTGKTEKKTVEKAEKKAERKEKKED